MVFAPFVCSDMEGYDRMRAGTWLEARLVAGSKRQSMAKTNWRCPTARMKMRYGQGPARPCSHAPVEKWPLPGSCEVAAKRRGVAG